MSSRGGERTGDLFRPPAYHDRGAPEAGARIPTRWRGCGDSLLERRWRDLFDWVEWLLTAFDVDLGRAQEGMWWRSAGAVEELNALREWHRELVDVVIPASPMPDGLDAEATIAFERKERAMRAAAAAELVSWHQSRASVCHRLFSSAPRPLLVRRAEDDHGSDWSEQCSSARVEDFDRFLADMGERDTTT